MRYTVVIEKGETSYGAYIPDLPGCVAVGETLEEVKQMIAEAIEFYIEKMPVAYYYNFWMIEQNSEDKLGKK